MENTMPLAQLPLSQIAFLALVLAGFASFGITLAVTVWRCRDPHPVRAGQAASRRPHGAGRPAHA